MNKWLESAFLKRAILALVTAKLAYLGTHHAQILMHFAPWISALADVGIKVDADALAKAVQVDPEKFADQSTIIIFGLLQGGHEWLAAKFPKLGAYL